MSHMIVWFGVVCGLFAVFLATWAVAGRYGTNRDHADKETMAAPKALITGATVGAVLYFGCILVLLGQAIIVIAVQ